MLTYSPTVILAGLGSSSCVWRGGRWVGVLGLLWSKATLHTTLTPGPHKRTKLSGATPKTGAAAAAAAASAAGGPSSSTSSEVALPGSDGTTAAAASVQLPTGLRDVASLLSSISIVADSFSMPCAVPPGGLRTRPRGFQLQVRKGGGETAASVCRALCPGLTKDLTQGIPAIPAAGVVGERRGTANT